jgi:hypothetical protein
VSDLLLANSSGTKSLSREEWLYRRDSHRNLLNHWAQDRVERAGVAEKHPVYDFLFTYYAFRPAHLLRWSPGADVALLDVRHNDELDWPLDYTEAEEENSFVIPAKTFPEQRRGFITWARSYLEGITRRPATFNCYGLHEWAMLYREDIPRHSTVSLRVSKDAIAAVVERSELRCTHYDAYRFFTPGAAPLNRFNLTRANTPDNDQAGCIHVNMDLYKFSFKLAPWCPSDIISQAFLLAREAREIDMRASPYDLSPFGFSPIRIEEPDGRLEYIAAQRALSEKAEPIRRQLINVYRYLEEQQSSS